MYNVVKDKILVSGLEKEDVSTSGIILSAKKKVGTSEHVVVNSGVDYLKEGDVVVCESPHPLFDMDGYDGKVGITNALNALLVKRGDVYKPLRNDILIQLKKSNEVNGGLIYVEENHDDSSLQSFTVIDVGEDCKDVSINDLVVVPWLNITPPFNLKGYESYGVTCETEVVAILEED